MGSRAVQSSGHSALGELGSKPACQTMKAPVDDTAPTAPRKPAVVGRPNDIQRRRCRTTWPGDSRVTHLIQPHDASRRGERSWSERAALDVMPKRVAEQVAEILAVRTRVVTVRQVAHQFFSSSRDPMANARRCIRSLRRAGLVESWHTAVGELGVAGPLLTNTEEHATPDFGAVAWKNEKRWKEARPQKATCVVATQEALDRFAGSCREPRPNELEHDLALAAVYFQLLRTDGEAASSWRHEDTFAARRAVRPDATYRRDGATVSVDLLGRGYTKPKIEALWRAYEGRPLELW